MRREPRFEKNSDRKREKETLDILVKDKDLTFNMLEKFAPVDAEIIDIKTKKPEFLEWKWIDLESLTKVVVDFKLHVYQEIKKKLELLLVNRS